MITVVIATRNRADLLAECLESLAAQRCRHADWGVLVVDNGSTDRTARLAQAFAQRHRHFRSVRESQLGVSRARNRGAAEAQTPFVLYVDDECIFPDGYVDMACQIASRPGVACFGGPIHARFHETPPRPRWYKTGYGSFSLPDDNISGAPPSLSAGNLGLSRTALSQLGGFSEAYGPVGTRMIYGEENELVARIWTAYGADAVVYEPRLVNCHLVRGEKYQWRTIVSENFGRGLARGRLHAMGYVGPYLSRTPDSPTRQSATELDPGLRLGRLPLGRGGRLAVDAFLDATLMRYLVERHRYPHWQNVVYERWMAYVRWAGVAFGIAAVKLGIRRAPRWLSRRAS